MNEKIMKQEAQYDWLKDEVHCLNAEMNNLQKRIDKAIEYIRNNSYKFLYYEETDEGQIDLSKCKYRITPLRATKVKQLLDILKGSDKSE